MMKKYRKILIFTSLLALLPIVAGLILWNQLPDQVPIHWDIHGQVDGWAGKPMAVFGLPLILVVLHWFTAFAIFCADPKRQNHSEKIINLTFWIIPALSILVHSFVYATILGAEADINMITPIFLGLLFTVVGNFLPKCKQNYTVGIKIPWTLNSEENWNKTHRFAGVIWVIGGLAILVTGLFGLLWAFLPITLLMVLVPTVYSFLLYRKGI